MAVVGGGHLDGQFVEIQGVDGPVEARDCTGGFLGEAVEPNGRRGWAHWDEVGGSYAVDTLDGVVLAVEEAHLQASSFLPPEAGGADLLWPSLPMPRAGPSFALKVADTLRRQGYCMVDMPKQKDDGLMMRNLGHFPMSHPGPDVAEIYFGQDSNCICTWLEDQAPPFDLAGEFMSQWYDYLVSLSQCLVPLTEGFLGFRAAGYHGGTMLRRPAANTTMREGAMMTAATEEDVEQGVVERHLDFARRRRICLMYFLRSYESIELRSKADPSAAPLHLPTRSDRLLLFRHDLFGYRCPHVNGSETILQTWLLEEPTQLEIDGIQGSQRSLERLLGGPTLSSERQVHVMNAICRFPAGAYRLEGDWAAYTKQSDGFIEIPIIRFDVDQYWEPAGQFNGSGKSSTKHAGLISDEELMNFDNSFFDIEPAMASNMPCIQRVLLELASELFSMVDFAWQSGAGKNLYTAVADIGLEWDSFQGLHADPTCWLKSAPMQMLSINRLCRTFNLSGPAHQVDTACSASLVASNMGHAYIRKHDVKGITQSMAMGLQHIIYPWPFIGLSGAGMLGSGGRCKTFDQSANGYNRGEGSGGLFSKVSDDVTAVQERLACYCGSYVNQDGRSASLTAPNGPSQQAVMRGSLGQADIQPDMVSATENHGTGTALGDPIETGSIRAVFKRRFEPLPVTSGKTHMGHLEAGAGAVGILKMLCQITHGGVPPNCHLRQPNAHCEFEGFPGAFPVEVLDLPKEYHYGGCNGFGFGGTNSRADFWAHRRSNIHRYHDSCRQVVIEPKLIGAPPSRHRPLLPRLDRLDSVMVQCARCLGPMCWLCGAVPPEGTRTGRHRCADIRAEAASYDYCSRCYEGGYLRGGPEEASAGLGGGGEYKVFLRGTWTAWTTLDEMKRVPDPSGSADVFEGRGFLGETRLEQFHLEVHRGKLKQVLQPIAKRASQRIRIGAPSQKAAPGLHWLLDGHTDGVPQGTAYRIRFEWGEEGFVVTWTPEGAADEEDAQRCRHKYFLVSSLSGWVPHIGTNDKDDKSAWRWFLGHIPASGKVELMFVRDEDMSQMIYPAKHCPKEESVPAVGPDEGGDGRRWLVWGEEGEQMIVNLKVHDGRIEVTLITKSMGGMAFTGSTDRTYHVWSHQQLSPMRRDQERPDVWRIRCTIGEAGREEFQIWANENPNLRIYPAGGGSPGQDLACGPDRKGLRKFWQLVGPPGSSLEIVLDLGAEDQCRMVTCRPCTSPEGARALPQGIDISFFDEEAVAEDDFLGSARLSVAELLLWAGGARTMPLADEKGSVGRNGSVCLSAEFQRLAPDS